MIKKIVVLIVRFLLRSGQRLIEASFPTNVSIGVLSDLKLLRAACHILCVVVQNLTFVIKFERFLAIHLGL